jgi:hypothetical protein
VPIATVERRMRYYYSKQQKAAVLLLVASIIVFISHYFINIVGYIIRGIWHLRLHASLNSWKLNNALGVER